MLSGHSLVEADELRKAMAKKNKSEALKQLAARAFEMLARFADYGFNKSRATEHSNCNLAPEPYAASLTAETNKATRFRIRSAR